MTVLFPTVGSTPRLRPNTIHVEWLSNEVSLAGGREGGRGVHWMWATRGLPTTKNPTKTKLSAIDRMRRLVCHRWHVIFRFDDSRDLCVVDLIACELLVTAFDCHGRCIYSTPMLKAAGMEDSKGFRHKLILVSHAVLIRKKSLFGTLQVTTLGVRFA